MTVEEIFNKLASHAREGVRFHDEMARAYEFIGLYGLSKCHIAHALEEKCGLNHLLYYYTTHYFKLLQYEELSQSKLIPDSWYKYTTQVVDAGTKRNAIKEFMEKWIKWEQDTKKLYQEMRQELCNIGEIAAALYIDTLIEDVTKELCHAQKKLVRFETIGYDIIKIIEWQDEWEKKYNKKLGW